MLEDVLTGAGVVVCGVFVALAGGLGAGPPGGVPSHRHMRGHGL